MTDDPVAIRLARSWVRLYTRGLPSEIGERRALEIESDVWEHLCEATDGRVPREILGRTLRGMHADVWWRYRTLLDQRGARQRSHDMTTTTRRNWWTPVTTVIGVVVATMGLLGLTLGETASGSGGALLLAAAPPAVGGLLIVGGVVIRRRHVVAGSRVVIAGAVLTALDPILIPVAVLVVVGGLWTGDLAAVRRPDRPVLAPAPGAITARWYRWIVASVVLLGVGLAVVATAEAVLDTDACTELEPCWEGTAVWATWVLSLLAAMVTAGIGAVLGGLRRLTRHHTRPA